MLKIKDNVSLKTLKKYNFQEVSKYIYNFRGKKYYFDNYINDGLVEKVSDD